MSYTDVTALNFMSKRCAPNNHSVPLKNNRAVDKEIAFKKYRKIIIYRLTNICSVWYNIVISEKSSRGVSKTEGMKSNEILLMEQSNGDLMYVRRRKGSNPDRKKFPMLKCPLCKKNLHTVFNAGVKNDAFLFDVDDEKYRLLSRNHVYKCARCHHTIGVHYLNAEEKRFLSLLKKQESGNKTAPA